MTVVAALLGLQVPTFLALAEALVVVAGVRRASSRFRRGCRRARSGCRGARSASAERTGNRRDEQSADGGAAAPHHFAAAVFALGKAAGEVIEPVAICQGSDSFLGRRRPGDAGGSLVAQVPSGSSVRLCGFALPKAVP